MTWSDTSTCQHRIHPPWWTLSCGNGPVIGVALHSGHRVRPEVARALGMPEVLRNDGPAQCAAQISALAPSYLVMHQSRCELDIDRCRSEAIAPIPQPCPPNTRHSADAAPKPLPGHPHTEPPRSTPVGYVLRSQFIYDAFYATARALLALQQRRFGRFVVVEVHSHGPPFAARSSAAQPRAPHRPPPATRVAASQPIGSTHASHGRPLRISWPAPGLPTALRDLVMEQFVEPVRSVANDAAANDAAASTSPSSPAAIPVQCGTTRQPGHFMQWVRQTFPGTGYVLRLDINADVFRQRQSVLEQALLRGLGALNEALCTGMTS